MAPWHPNNDSSSPPLPSLPIKDSNRQSGKGSGSNDSAPSPRPHDSDSPESAPSPSPPLLPPLRSPPLSKPPPPTKVFSPLPLPHPPPTHSPPPPPPSPPPPPPSPPLLSPPPPSPPPLSPPPSSPPPPPPSPSSPPPYSPPPSPSPPLPSPSPPPPSLHQSNSSLTPPPPNHYPPKQSSTTQFQAPPPPERASSPPSSRSANSNDSNHQAMHRGGSHAQSRGSSPSDHYGKYIGYALAGVFFIALVAVVVIFTFRRKKARVDVYGTPYMPPPNNNFHLILGAGHYYVQQPGPQPSLGNNYGSGKGGGSMMHLGALLESPRPKSAQLAFSYDMVMEITNAFSSQNVIGEGGFGCVYKGWLPEGKAVAVKRLKAGSGQGDREFRAEVEIISRVHHRHLVSLVGYCISEQQRVLIYEYIPNGTLHHHLHGHGMPVLDWAKRLKIAIGAAKGLAYLHEDCSQKIIHRDIKSANILLDHAFEAKVSDFGLARLADAANTHVSTRVMGTFGYLAPEYATSGKLTDRSDVFSFGVVLLELLTGRKPVDETQPLGDESLVEWARPLLLRAFETRDFSELVDPRLQNHFVESEMFRMIDAAAACVRHSAPNRPRMAQVVRALDSGDEIPDLSNGVKYGQSTVYDSGQYDKDIMLFRRLANGSFVTSDFDMYSREYSFSRETSRSQHACTQSSSSGESESRAFNKHRSSTG